MISDRVKELVEQFHEHRDSYKSTDYKEHELEQDFINPFWEALGWDVTNKQGLAQGYRDVIVQPGLRIDGTMKAPDYVFRAGSEKKFYLEVKAPKVNIAKDPAPAHQLKSYAWTAGLSISFLSNFEEFAVYQTTAIPKLTDAPFKDRVEFFGYEQYEEKWDWLWENFSREGIWKGRFDKYASQAKGKRGTTPFDKAFLADMHDWRKKLAENIALRNKGLSESELNFAVQVTLDRIIMLRICEGRKIEQYGNLAVDAGLQDIIGLKREKITGVYKNLLKRFDQADDRFNSGLFHFKKEKGREHFDALTPRLAIDDKVLTDIIKHLYYPERPYAFDVVPSDILGHVYEKFLGQVITLTKGGNARVEDKPEVNNAGGVFYTPTYIVDYIVKNTVGQLLDVDRDSTRSLPTLKILDPACGSGSFLLGAYQYLLDWYLRYYHENNPESWAKKKVLDAIPTANKDKKEYRLSIAERKRILLEHIHGVDIDSNAVEVAKLNLMLKVLEGGQAQSGAKSEHRIAYDVSERLLPDLEKNIVCGNSLIGLNYFDQLETEPDMPERAKINAMDWRDAFPEIMKTRGFDVVIGNPPYGAQMQEGAKEYFLRNYHLQNYQADSYLLFLEKSLKALVKKDGLFGMIFPNPWLSNLLQTAPRRFITSNTVIESITHFQFKVFINATVDTEVVILRNSLPNHHVVKVIIAFTPSFDRDESESKTLLHKQERWQKLDGEPINIFLTEEQESLQSKIAQGKNRLESLCKINVGIKPYQVGKGTPPQTRSIVDDRIFDSESKKNKDYRQYLRGKDIGRYKIEPLELRYIKFGPWLAEPRPAADFDANLKILMRQTGDSLVGALDDQHLLCLNNMHVVVPFKASPPIEGLLAILNSRLLNWYYHTLNPEEGEALAEVKKSHVASLPIPDENYRTDLWQKLTVKSKQIISILKNQDHTLLDRQLAATDREIDRLVYELYELTEEEIRIVEGE